MSDHGESIANPQSSAGIGPHEVPCPTSRDDFRVAIICVRPHERQAVEEQMYFDFKYDALSIRGVPGDSNYYTHGALGGKPVVVAISRDAGTKNASNVAKNIIKLGGIVGFAGGAPRNWSGRREIYLGDVLISTQVAEYNFGRLHEGGLAMKREAQSTLGRHDAETAKLLNFLQSGRPYSRLVQTTKNHTADAVRQDKECQPAEPDTDLAYVPEFTHKHRDPDITCDCSKPDSVCLRARDNDDCDTLRCGEHALSSSESAPRKSPRVYIPEADYKIHFGKIASSSAVLKDGKRRNTLVERDDYIGFEMEGAGTWDTFPTIVIKGVSDYADGHKNKIWQPFAATRAAACARALLERWELPENE